MANIDPLIPAHREPGRPIRIPRPGVPKKPKVRVDIGGAAELVKKFVSEILDAIDGSLGPQGEIRRSFLKASVPKAFGQQLVKLDRAMTIMLQALQVVISDLPNDQVRGAVMTGYNAIGSMLAAALPQTRSGTGKRCYRKSRHPSAPRKLER